MACVKLAALQESSMRNQAGPSVICGLVFALLSSLASAAGREGGDACSFPSRNKISAILGLAIDAGRHIGPVSAIGDDAYYIDTPGFGVGLNVKKGAFAFQVKVFGFSPETTKTMESSL